MCGKAKHGLPVLVLLAPSATWRIRLNNPTTSGRKYDVQINFWLTVTVMAQIRNNTQRKTRLKLLDRQTQQ